MYNEEINRSIRIDDTRFIFATNFAGDPNKDKYRSQTRKGNIVIPDADFAQELADRGFNVKVTRPKEGEEEGFEPEYFVSVIVRYGPNKRRWPKIYVVTNGRRTLLDEDTVGDLDDMWIKNVNVILNPNEYEEGKYTLYVDIMYVEENTDDDPYASRYSFED